MKKAKRILSSLLAALFLAVSLPLSALPVMALGFAGGSGTASDPYLIQTPAQLQAMEEDLSAHYRLSANLSLNGIAWRPIGDAEHPFTGSLDGNGYSITGLNLSYSGTPAEPVRAGLFDLLQGSVEDLSLSGSITADLSGTAIQAGLLAAEMQDAAVSGCTFAGEITLTTSGNDSGVYAALLAGTMNDSERLHGFQLHHRRLPSGGEQCRQPGSRHHRQCPWVHHLRLYQPWKCFRAGIRHHPLRPS